MKIQGIISAAVLTFSAVLSAPTFACTVGGGILSNEAQQNENLGCGKYEFANINTESFTDRWSFTVSENMTALISVFDLESEDDSTSTFDTTNLQFTLYDRETAQFLGWANENGTLGTFNLVTGREYVIKVYGDIGGISGSSYQGLLDTSVAEVPVGPTAPLLGSALGLLALRLRKRTAA